MTGWLGFLGGVGISYMVWCILAGEVHLERRRGRTVRRDRDIRK